MECKNFEELGLNLIDALIVQYAQEDMNVTYIVNNVCETLEKTFNVTLNEVLTSQVKKRIMKYTLCGKTTLNK